jgi:2-methylcitrate dehydratase PrpD
MAEFCAGLRYEDLKPETLQDAKNAILDWTGVALVGSTQDSAQIVFDAASQLDGGGKSTLMGRSKKASLATAALVNGLAGHALDYDDVQHRTGVHMSSPVLPGLLALAENRHSTGREFITSYLSGMELGCRLGRAARYGNYLRMHGIHPTGFLGHFGAAAGIARLLAATNVQMQHALGIVAGKAMGLMRSFGTMCKPMNAGNAASDGLLSAMMAKEGFIGPEEIFDGKHNIFETTGGATDPEVMVRDLGTEWEVSFNTFKLYACTGWRNPIVEALIVISTQHKLKPADVKKIHVQVYDEMSRLPDLPEPRTGLEGKFSVAHVCSVALADRAGGIAQFTDERVADPVLADLRKRVTVERGDDLDHYQVRAFVTTNDGRELTHFVPIPKGDHLRPMTTDELEGKFRANAATILPKAKVNKLVSLIRNIEEVGDMAEIAKLCAVSGRSRR